MGVFLQDLGSPEVAAGQGPAVCGEAGGIRRAGFASGTCAHCGPAHLCQGFSFASQGSTGNSVWKTPIPARWALASTPLSPVPLGLGVRNMT